MINWRCRLIISSNIYRASRLRGCFMATASNFTWGQRDFQMSLRRFSSSTSSLIGISNRGLFNNALRVERCCSENIGNLFRNNDITIDHGKSYAVQKARAYGPSLLRASDAVVKMEEQPKSLNSKAVNGDSDANRGNFAGVLGYSSQEKAMLAVDVDEVLGNFVSALNKFIAARYSLNHTVSEYYVYEFFKIWNCSRDEADHRVHEFFKTPYFKKGIYPIPGARETLEKLSASYNLSIVTSRQNAIKDHTIEWVEKHYPGLFQEIHFGNHFALDGKSRPKSEICKSLGAKILIDDNPRYAMECASVGIKVLLFDYENSYPWCNGESLPQHPLVTKVHNWEEVEDELTSWVVS